MVWDGVGWGGVGPGWVRLGWVGSGWVGLGRVGLGRVELGGWGWVGVGIPNLGGGVSNWRNISSLWRKITAEEGEGVNALLGIRGTQVPWNRQTRVRLGNVKVHIQAHVNGALRRRGRRREH